MTGRFLTRPAAGASLRVALVTLALLAGVLVAAAIPAGVSRAWKSDCWLYCESKAPPRAFVEALGRAARFSADRGVPVRTINALGAKLVGGGYVPGSVDFTASGAHTVSERVFVETVEVIGGGGGAGNWVSGNTGGGGCGAGYSKGVLSVSPAQTVTVTIGAAGLANTGGAAATGGTTTVSTISATGGSGGLNGSTAGPAPCTTPGTGSGGSLLNYSGGTGTNNRTGSAAGGGAAGPSGAGGSTSNSVGGVSGGSPAGAGGNHLNPGNIYGGGGGAGGNDGSGIAQAGAPGFARFTW